MRMRGEERKGRAGWIPPAPSAHVDVLLLLPVVLNEVAGDAVELLAVALHLQDGALHVAQQLLVLRWGAGAAHWGGWGSPGPSPRPP